MLGVECSELPKKKLSLRGGSIRKAQRMWRCAQPCVLLATALAAVAFIGSASSAAAAGQANPLPDPAGPLPETAETRAADAIFQQLLQDPKNVDLTFRYAEAAV